MHEVRWIGNGSGNIKVKNNNISKSIEFCIDKEEVKYFTGNKTMLETFNKISLSKTLKELWRLKTERDSLFQR